MAKKVSTLTDQLISAETEEEKKELRNSLMSEFRRPPSEDAGKSFEKS